jgi:hypothetical protein
MRTTIATAAIIIGMGMGVAPGLSASRALAETAPATAIATWVSNAGVDSGVCSLAAPCRTFQYALDRTSPGGEVDVKDAGRFGPLTITKSISIVAVGVQAGMSVPSLGDGIVVNAGANDIVIIRGLTIDGHGSGYYGRVLGTAAHVIVEDCVVQGMVFYGITTNSGGFAPTRLTLSNVVLQHDNTGLYEVSPAGTNPTAPYTHIVNSKILHNVVGLHLYGGTSEIVGTIIQDNPAHGLESDAVVHLSGSTLSQNGLDVFDDISSSGNNLVLDATFARHATPDQPL